MKRVDLLLKIVAAANGETVTPAQLQKVAFLLGQKFAGEMPSNYYRFRKYDYGPFCVDIYRDAEHLQRDGLISITVNPRGGWKEYAGTRQGLEENLDKIPDAISKYIAKKMKWAREISFQELVREIYRKFPEYTENSVFQD